MTSPYAAEPPVSPYGAPTYVAAGAGSAPTRLASATIAVAVAMASVEAATAVASFLAAERFADKIRLGGSPLDVFTFYDGLELLLFPVMVAAYVVGCLWLHRARTNTAVTGPRVAHKRAKIWVWLGWWVPIVSFWFPYQVVRERQHYRQRVPRGAPAGVRGVHRGLRGGGVRCVVPDRPHITALQQEALTSR